MKRLIAFVLSLVMLCTLTIPAFAVGPVTPTAPEWIDAEDYLVFPGDEVYQPENWAKVLEMRAEAANGGLRPGEDDGQWRTGEGSAGLRYETGLVRLKNAENEGLTTPEALRTFGVAGWHFEYAKQAWYKQNGGETDETYYRLRLASGQATGIYHQSKNYEEVDAVTKALGIDPEEYFDGPYMELFPAEVKAKVLADLAAYRVKEARRIRIELDGGSLAIDVEPEIRNGRTMVPIRAVSEALGAVVEWDGNARRVTMTRAGRVVTMTIGSTTATVDGQAREMDVAPYISGGRTLIPARFVAEFFGQKVGWVESPRTVLIEEDKSVAGGSGLEAWALPMGAMLTKLTVDAEIDRFGLWPRSKTIYYPTSGVTGIAPPGGGDYVRMSACELCRKTLRDSWGVEGREDLIRTVMSMTYEGHNSSFLAAAAQIAGMSKSEYERYTAANAVNAYMFPYTEQLSEKWGERGILCWDLFRMSNLVQWGYMAGYVTYAEALALLGPAATLLCEEFSSWDEAYENYLDGYYWWARENVLGEDIWQTPRGTAYVEMSQSAIFDDSLFQKGVTPVPGITAEQLLAGLEE